MNDQYRFYYKEYTNERHLHWETLADEYSHGGIRSEYHRRLITIYRQIIPAGQAVLEVGCAKGDLLAALSPGYGVGIDFSEKMISHARNNYSHLHFIKSDAHNLEQVVDKFDYIIFSDLVDDLWDVQVFLEQLQRLSKNSTRIVFNFYSHLWSLPLRLAQSAGIATPMLPQNWLTVEDMKGLLHLTGFNLISHRAELLFPLPIPGLTPLCNRFLAKIKPFSYLDLTHIMVAAPQRQVEPSLHKPTVSVVVPARNEAGNIAAILDRVPVMGGGTELIFVEGGSSDNTYAVIEAAIRTSKTADCRLLRQTGTGKGDAVRMGFEHASGEILMILDADLTVAPEDLVKFYNALVDGRGDFINGVRLVYPLRDKAMRFMNLVGNKFFSLAFTWLLGQTVKDTLCGTKAIWKTSYQNISDQRCYFGEFDPFGDFDLLLGSVRLNLKIIDLPIRYGERTYGETNINRWSHGFLLFRMLLLAARKLKFI